MKQTVLDIVQDILNDISSDQVNSIDDTEESRQVAKIVRSTYFSLMASMEWPHLRKPVQLVPHSTLDRPSHMKLAEEVTKIEHISYDKAKSTDNKINMQPVHYREPDQFLKITNQEDSSSSKVQAVEDLSGITLLIRNDRAPTYYTSFDDENLVFDSYDKESSDTLMSSKSQALAYITPQFQLIDDHYPDLPNNMFPMLVEEAKSRSAAKLRQVVDSKSESFAQLHRTHQIKQSARIDRDFKRPDYGRKTRRG